MTIREACLQASSFLTGNGVEAGDAAASAEWLLEHLLGCSRSELFMRWNESFPAEQSERWNGLLERRAAGEPVQYIIGEQEFYGLPFRVTSAVLIPRPETELLVEKVMELGRRRWPEGRPLVADIGCGSGAIPVTLAVKCSPWNITASDISPEAIEVARRNALLNGVGDKVAFYQGDLLEVYIRERIAIDILVSNPPYIESGDIAFLQREVRLHEPVLALDGGTDGLDFYRRIVGQVELLPSPPALIGFEVGQGQAPAVAELLRIGGHWDEIIVVPDLAGIERHVIGLKKN
ncbi:peptide chain release factor N(5)-glutamine methyltransferase [Paenibacillus ginsengarvi]|uniref:Release factor glutamine methyltransferase n=1 Tax=Paenibacillus ginsengarvi TaxID=400777 RepID=A0A3B0C078_9BACL|nr:peptide chain release factor N(5)-glutamine methyltransferase [Paenibacillus ginsengarvi]RKN78932.1 peptide chain release factor N(5)-glutamine methyltransferase [Paenibacillus ginsengarvi]